MRYALSALVLLAGFTSASAQVSTARVGVTPTADPEPVYVLDKNNVWNPIGTMTAGIFTPVATAAGGDVNVAKWNNVVVGSPTAAGVIGTGNFPNLNSYLTSAGLATTAAPTWTEGQPVTFSFDRSGGLRVSGQNTAPLGVQPISNSQAVNPATSSVWNGNLGVQSVAGSQAVNPATSSVWPTSLAASSVASGAFIANSFVLGALADGAITTMGTQADTAWVSGSGSEIAILKKIAANTSSFNGSVTQAAGSVASGAYTAGSYVDGAIATMGAQADAVWSGSGSGSEIAILKKIASASAASGNVFQATNFVTGTASAAATTQQFAASGATVIYLVNYSYQTDGGATGPGTFQIVAGGGTNCATGQTALTPVWNFAASNGIAEGTIGVIGTSAAGNALCVKTTTTVKVNWRIGIAQQ